MQPVENVQTKYLQRLGISESDALFHFHLAPLSSRRDMAMLGLIHRMLLGRGPAQFRRFFFLEKAPTSRVRTRSASRCHFRRVHEHVDGSHLEVVKRSALGLTNVYNMLPAEVVQVESVSAFQRQLQDMLKNVASGQDDSWARLLSPRHPLHAHPLHVF